MFIENLKIKANQVLLVAYAALTTDSPQVLKHNITSHKCSKHLKLNWNDESKWDCVLQPLQHCSNITHCLDCAGGIVESTLITIKKKTFEDAGGCHDDPC